MDETLAGSVIHLACAAEARVDLFLTLTTNGWRGKWVPGIQFIAPLDTNVLYQAAEKDWPRIHTDTHGSKNKELVCVHPCEAVAQILFFCILLEVPQYGWSHYGSIIPRLIPIIAACVRSFARNFERMFLTRPLTVSSVTESSAAICLLALPAAISRNTSTSP